MKRWRAWVLFLAAFSLPGCGLLLAQHQEKKTSEMMATWEGAHYSKLLDQWGPPQRIMDDGKGGQIFTYFDTRSQTIQGPSQTHHSYGPLKSSTTYHSPAQTITYERTRSFYINKDGIIYDWQWSGL